MLQIIKAKLLDEPGHESGHKNAQRVAVKRLPPLVPTRRREKNRPPCIPSTLAPHNGSGWRGYGSESEFRRRLNVQPRADKGLLEKEKKKDPRWQFIRIKSRMVCRCHGVRCCSLPPRSPREPRRRSVGMTRSAEAEL